MWGGGVLAYVCAVLQRTSLGVSGLEASARFDTGASLVATFVVVQLLVYALAQVPAGVLLDRFGPRATLTAGALAMAAGQVLLGQTEHVGGAVLARIVVGCGDALTFSSAVRLVPAWFPAQRVPLLTQLTGIIGQLGQILSAIPFVALLHAQGWTAAFTAAGALEVLAALAVILLVRARPAGAAAPKERPGVRRIPADVRGILRHPATHLGFWVHWTSGMPGMVFAMMWGFPYLTAGEGLPVPLASGIMTLYVVATIASGPLIGAMTQRHPLRRSSLVLLVVATGAVPLAVLLAWPGRAPLWLLAVVVVALAVGGPGSSVGFDFPRTSLAGRRLGTATGVVIMGGFTGALVCILLAGVVLDLARGAGLGELAPFRLALAVQLPFLVLGVVGMLRSRRRLRERMAQRGLHVPRWRDVWRAGRLTRL